MATRRQAGPTISSGRRGYLRYQYGTHFWIPVTQADWSKGMVRDTAREAIPPGAVYDSADYLLHQPGVAQKRGGTGYFGTAISGPSYIRSVGCFNSQNLIAVGSDDHAYKVLVGSNTDLGGMGYTSFAPPVISPGGTYAILPGNAGAATAQKYNGTAISNLGTSPPSFYAAASYKSRLVVLGTDSKIYFSPTPDPNGTWDTTNSWITPDYGPPSALAALNNALLIWSPGHMERIIGATPPPNSDMDRAPLAGIGCTDQRSVCVADQVVYFANPQGVYLTNGTTPIDITARGGMSSYWRSLFSGYVAANGTPSASTWTISAGAWKGFLFVCVLDASRNIVAGLMCYTPRFAWWRVTNMAAHNFALDTFSNELYYADASTNRVVAVSSIFSPAAGNKNDANGTAVTPTIEFAPIGQGSGVKSYGFGRLDFDMRDAATDNPTMAVTVKSGVEADTSSTPTESPLIETLTLDRKRFSVCKDAQALTIALAQTNASSKTEIYALEVEQRPQSLVGDGIS